MIKEERNTNMEKGFENKNPNLVIKRKISNLRNQQDRGEVVGRLFSGGSEASK